MDYTICESCKRQCRPTASYCQRNHTSQLCLDCRVRKCCPKCTPPSVLSSSNRVCNVCRSYGDIVLLCRKHNLCSSCHRKQGSLQCSVCNVPECSQCHTNPATTLFDCRKHKVCESCWRKTIACELCKRMKTCTRCHKQMDKGFQLYRCYDEVCQKCGMEVSANPERCSKCADSVDRDKVEVFRRIFPEVCAQCGSNKGKCVCGVGVASRVGFQGAQSNVKTKLEMSLQKQPKQQSGNGSKRCEICQSIVESELISGLCKFCVYVHRT